MPKSSSTPPPDQRSNAEIAGGDLMDMIRHHDTLTNRSDTREGRMANAIQDALMRRAIAARLDGHILTASQEIAALVVRLLEQGEIS